MASFVSLSGPLGGWLWPGARGEVISPPYRYPPTSVFWLVMGRGLVLPFGNSRVLFPLCHPAAPVAALMLGKVTIYHCLRMCENPFGMKGANMSKSKTIKNGTGRDTKTKCHNGNKSLVAHSETWRLSFWIQASQGLISSQLPLPTAAHTHPVGCVCCTRAEKTSFFPLIYNSPVLSRCIYHAYHAVMPLLG